MKKQIPFGLIAILTSNHNVKWVARTLRVSNREALRAAGELLGVLLNGHQTWVVECEPKAGYQFPPRLLLWHKGLACIRASNQPGGHEIYPSFNGQILRHVGQPANQFCR